MTFKLQIQTGVNWTVHDAAEEAIKVRRYGINNHKLIKNVFTYYTDVQYEFYIR